MKSKSPAAYLRVVPAKPLGGLNSIGTCGIKVYLSQYRNIVKAGESMVVDALKILTKNFICYFTSFYIFKTPHTQCIWGCFLVPIYNIKTRYCSFSIYW